MPLSAYWHLLRDNRNVRLLWSAQIVSEMGDWFYSVAIFSFLIEITGSAQMVAFAFLMQVLPQVFMSPSAGVINDRISRKKVMIFADLSRAGIVLAMLLVRSAGMLWLLFLLLALETSCYALFEPGRSATIPNVARPEQVPVANALSSATWSVVFASGAALGGIVDVAFGRETVFVLDSLSFVASALLIRRMHFSEPHAQDRPHLRIRELFDFRPIAEGLRYVARDRKLLAVLLVKGGVGVMGINWVILPVLGQKLFPVQLAGLTSRQAGTLGMSTFFASRGLGATIGAILGGNFAGVNARRLYGTILASFLMSAVGYAALGLAGSLAFAAATVVFSHTGGSAAWTASTTLLQQMTEDQFRGRVFSAEFALYMLAMAISSFVAGQLLDRGASVQMLAVATGAATLLPALAWLRWGPRR
ncbi:MAG: MFS transporter [Acidobacteriia bacterium]|nr:MFS transporter [Terriglobia bacterium]